jgi:UDP-2,3-diacylglucosamine pyrophosphatase LpxH
LTIPPRHYRTIWISDLHLGTRGAKAEFLLDFLRHTESEYLYLVGDIVDGWRLRRSWYWAQSHNDVIQKVLRKARKGTRVYYIPGNHDEWLRDYTQLQLGGVQLLDEVVHVTADGRRLLVLHGDAFDGVVRYAKWLALLGDWAYTAALHLNHYFNLVRRRFGYPYWSLSAYLKGRVKNAVEFVSNFADAIAAEARQRGVDGIVCGHIHQAEMRDIGGVLYCNDGDWVESCTALVEHFDGHLEILHWAQLRALDLLAAPPSRRREPEPESEPEPAVADAT